MIDRYYIYPVDIPEDGTMPTRWKIAIQQRVGFDDFVTLESLPGVYETRESAIEVVIDEPEPVCYDTLPCELVEEE